MKLMRFSSGPSQGFGVISGDGVIDVTLAAEARGIAVEDVSIEAVIRGGRGSLERLARIVEGDVPSGALRTFGSVLPIAPLSGPEKIVCVGLNYARHAAEAGVALPANPVVFAKFNNTLAGSSDAITLPPNAVEYDYEGELGVVIGKAARNVSETAALDHVFGYVVANDLSARDLQRRTSQWLLGKSLDGFLPLGPYVVTRDEVSDPQALSIRTHVNDELRQDATTRDMVFSVSEIISYLSRYMRLVPGDLILTGTPEGVVFGSDRPWLKPGDRVAVAVDGLGECDNMLVPGDRPAR